MMNKKYTVEEIRDVAQCMENLDFENLKVDNNGVCAMLRQAADMYERAEKQRKHLTSIVQENDSELTGITVVQVAKTELSIIDYILYGEEER